MISSKLTTIVYLHHFDSNEMIWENAWWEQNKNAECSFEQILEAAPHKTVSVRPITFHFTNRPSKTNKTCSALLVK